MNKLRKYLVGFLRGDEIVRTVIVDAWCPTNAYEKAEEIYKDKRWRIKYDDMYSEII